MSYVLNQQVGDGTQKLVLLAYANHAHKDGTAAWCSIGTVAEYAERSKRTVQSHVPLLVSKGFMREGDQRLVAHLPADRRPIVYDLSMSPEQRAQWAAEAVKNSTRRDASVAHGAEGGRRSAEQAEARRNAEASSQVDRGAVLAPGSDDLDGVQSLHDGVQGTTRRGEANDTRTVLDPSAEPSTTTTSPTPVADAPVEGVLEPMFEDLSESNRIQAVLDNAKPDPFDEFWSVYPNKASGPKAARKSFERAVKRVGLDVVMEGVRRFAADPNLPGKDEMQYIAHATTWLNNDKWEVEALPPRIGSKGRQVAVIDPSTPIVPSERFRNNQAVLDAYFGEQGQG